MLVMRINPCYRLNMTPPPVFKYFCQVVKRISGHYGEKRGGRVKRCCLFIGLFIAISSIAFGYGVMPKKESSASAPTVQAAKVEIFVTSWCPYCRKLEAFLERNQIEYTRYDVEADTKGAEIFEELGGSGVPVTRVGNEVIHGYDPERIIAAIKA